jgi:hypothetical protein
MKRGYRPGGQRIRRPDARGNAQVRKRPHGNVRHGKYALTLLETGYDARTALGKSVLAFKNTLIEHMGGLDAISAPQMALVTQAVQLGVLIRISWATLHREGNFRIDGTPAPALDVYLRETRALREVLSMLGLQRHEKELISLTEYLAQKADEANTSDAEVVQE